MKNLSPALLKALAARTAVAAAAVAACSGASAADTFSFNPAAAGFVGTPFTASSLFISDYAVITATGTGFTEKGFLSIDSAKLGGTTVATPGLGTSYSLFLDFSATGVGSLTSGTFSDASYTLYGVSGSVAFAPGMALPSGSTALGTGTFVASIPSAYGGTPGVITTAGVTTSFTSMSSAVTTSSTPILAAASFTNYGSTFALTSTGAVVNGGGGAITFASPVPEPETYALMLGGLAAIGFVARRRNNG